jgi:hypothetical protein
MAVPLSELVTPLDADEVMAQQLQIATAQGLVVTAWQPLSVARAIYQTNAIMIANYSINITTIAACGFASFAATLDSFIPLDLVSEQVYRVTRIPASSATCDNTGFSVTNASGSSYGPFAAGQLIFSNPVTGKEYVNAENAVTITAGVTTGVALIAKEPGAAYTTGPNTITNLVKPLVGCTCNNTAALVGADAETNAQLFARDIAKLSSLSNLGAANAYYYFATSILDPTVPFYDANLSQPVTRVKVVSAPARVQVYLANASGPLSGPDVAIVDAVFQAWAVPSGITTTTNAAGSASVNIVSTCYIPAAAGLTTLAVQNAVSLALTTYFENLQIGGTTDANPNVVPIGAIGGIIFAAIVELSLSNAANMSVTLTTPATDVPVASTAVPVLGSLTTNVVFT